MVGAVLREKPMNFQIVPFVLSPSSGFQCDKHMRMS